MKPHRTEHSPVVQELSQDIEERWNCVRSTMLGRPYTAGVKHRKYFVKTALMLIDTDIDLDTYIASTLRAAADAAMCSPSWLSSANAMSRFLDTSQKLKASDCAFYEGQIRLVDNLHREGFTWHEILHGTFGVSPLVAWVVSEVNGLQSDPFSVDATSELRRCPEAREVFGSRLEGLRDGRV